MTVIFANTTLAQIEQAIADAWGDGKMIDRIILTPDEWSGFCFSHGYFYGTSEVIYKGIKIIKEGGRSDVKCHTKEKENK